MGKLPVRKHVRLNDYDYSDDGSYFVTFCTVGRRKILSVIESKAESDKTSVGRFALGPPHDGAFLRPQPRLTEIGLIVQKYLESVSMTYDGVRVDKYVIMPNHVHAIITFGRVGGGTRASRPTGADGVSQVFVRKRVADLFTVVESVKSLSSREAGEKLWQTSFYDTIIRNELMYDRKWRYIDENPDKWNEDEYF